MLMMLSVWTTCVHGVGVWLEFRCVISQELINDLPDLCFSVDRADSVTSISSSVSTLLGSPATAVMGTALSELFAEPRAWAPLKAQVLAADGEVICQDICLRHAQGHEVQVTLRLRCCETASGESRIEGIARDLSMQPGLLNQLSDNDERFLRLSELSNNAVFYYQDGLVKDCNPAAERMFGYSCEELRGRSGYELIARTDVDRIRQFVSEGQDYSCQAMARHRDGSVFPIEIQAWQSLAEEPPVRVTCVRDLSAQHQMQQQARVLSEALQHCPVAVIITNPEGRVDYVNHAAVAMTGYSAGSLCELPHLADLFCLSLEPDAKWLRWKLALGKSWDGRLRLKCADGSIICVNARLTATQDSDVPHQMLLLEDITLQESHEEIIRRQAHYDSLTGLPNRTLAAERMEGILTQARDNRTQVAMLCLNLDEFRSINETLGHDCGDLLLQQVSEGLQQAIGRDHCLARLGADEFLVVVGGVRASTEVEALVERLLKTFESPFRIRDRSLAVTTSIGAALYPLDGGDFVSLLRSADTAMSQAKQRGKNGCCFFNSQMNQQAERRLQVASHLRWGLERDEFSLHYQPVIDFSTGRLLGAEALLRWNSAELGFVPPDQFIPVAESSGMIVAIGHWVLQEACQQAKLWQDAYGFPLRIAVNVSPRQFTGGDLVDAVQAALNHSGLAPGSLEIEVTEGLLMTHHADTRRVFRELSAMGVGIAIDDFGTGYSSLAYLEKFTFDTLKIDRSFVAGIKPGTRRDTLVRTIIAMAHGLELKVVAEGVETADQVARLSELGCDFAQGYHYSRPLCCEDFAAFLGAELLTVTPACANES